MPEDDLHLKRDVMCLACGWAGITGQLIVRHRLSCPKCKSDHIKYFIADAPKRLQ